MSGEVDMSLGTDALSRWETERILPVVVTDRPADASPLAEALLVGGLSCAEITLRTPAAIEVIRALSKHPDLVVGAGTVLDPRQAIAAIEAGARFVVSPGLDLDVLTVCRARGVFAVPGVATASEIQAARRAGTDVLKFFPAEALGGMRTIEALAGPFGGVRFVPTGGVTAENAADYLAQPAVLAVGGSWMVSAALLRAGDWGEVAARAGAAAELAGPRPPRRPERDMPAVPQPNDDAEREHHAGTASSG
jgi:2-dehydro-3-deoxyphosphogluconate aldolase / (4S)-4-hydroxy-2-oxoglutarate aldolase